MNQLVPHAAHWGAFTAETSDGRLTRRPSLPRRSGAAAAARRRCPTSRTRPAGSTGPMCGRAGSAATAPAARSAARRSSCRSAGTTAIRLVAGELAARARGARLGQHLRRQLWLVLGRALPPCAHAAAPHAGGLRRLHRPGAELLLRRGHDAAAASARRHRCGERAGGGLAGDLPARDAAGLLRRHPDAQRPGRLGRRRRARDGALGARGQARAACASSTSRRCAPTCRRMPAPNGCRSGPAPTPR